MIWLSLSHCIQQSSRTWIWHVHCAGYVCAQQARGPAKCWGEHLKKSNHLWKCCSASSKPKIGICSKSLLWGIKKFIVILVFRQLNCQNLSATFPSPPMGGWTLTSVSSKWEVLLAGVKRVHDVSEQAAFGMLPWQGALLPRRDHLRQRSHSGEYRTVLTLSQLCWTLSR